MRYSEELIEEIRSKNDILDVVSGYVHMQKKGGTYFGLCPFHNEKSASFSVSPSKQMFYCFGCGVGGTVFTFLQKYENYSFIEAVQALADRAGVALPEGDYSEADKEKENRRKRMLEINKEAAKYYFFQLRSPQGESGYKYLTGRGLTDDTIKAFGLGFANVTSNDLVKYLKSKGYDDQLIMDAGLGAFDEKYGLHDKFWNRVMYPIQDANHRVIGFGGRVMGDAKPKYLNSQETEIFDKSRNLYGLNFARSSRAGNIILCEGYMDVIAMHQAGFTQAVASLGTAFTSGQAMLVKRFAKRIYLAYDSDGAGTNAALRAIEILRAMDMSCRIINMEPYKDPDEFIKNLGKDAFNERIENAENSFFFELRILERDFDLKEPESRTEFTKKIAEKLCGFEEEVERENYIIAVADKYSIPTEQLRRLVITTAATGIKAKTIDRDKPKSGIQSQVTAEDMIRKHQRTLITWIGDEPRIYEIVKQYITPEDFTDPIYSEVVKQLFADFERGVFNPAAIASTFDNEDDQSAVAALFNTNLILEDEKDKGQALHDIIYTVKKNAVESRARMNNSDGEAIMRQISDKKALEKLRTTTINY